MSDIYTMDEVNEGAGEDGQNHDGVGQALTNAAVGEAVASGESEATPFVMLVEVMLAIGVIVAVVMTLAFVIPYLTTGHWPF